MTFPLCRFWGLWLALGTLVLGVSDGAQAQLARSFYNVTGIQTRVLPNAVQLTIQTDGTVAFGGDLKDFINIGTSRFDPKPITALRLRLLHARARLPAFINIGQYPVDSAVVSLGTDEFVNPFFSYRSGFSRGGRNDAGDPRVDIQLRFFVPVTVQRFLVDRETRNSSSDESDGDYSIDFNEFLGPRDVSVELGRDRRSIVVTVITDRLDTNGAKRLQRSPASGHHHRLSVTPIPNTVAPNLRLRIEALHTSLAEVLDAVSRATDLLLVARPDAEDVDVSLLLPDVSPGEFLKAIETGYGLIVAPRATEAGGGFDIGHAGGDPSSGEVLERLPVYNLDPEHARLLFPDFLLPLLRADKENNALVVSGSPALVSRVRSDLAKLDLPRAQVRVEVSVWEFVSTDDEAYALSATRSISDNSETVDTNAGQVSLVVQSDLKRAFTANLQALASRGRVHLAAKPFVVVASGERGTLFLGQSRYIKILRSRNGFQQVDALKLDIGYTLSVRPIVGVAGDITLDISPRASNVSTLEANTGLPTLGIREISSVMRVRQDDAIIVAGLDSDLNSSRRQHFPLTKGVPVLDPLLSARFKDREKTTFMLVVTAHKV
ncbi:MAG: hypothetical protein JO316_10990 [Abitibacteriaceae bacterium]|nr:hypothetical protein [Abditibacteriaceae bacterium]MBV9865870.1 hypothetical protein [Abditibacteriaceae bacterium]